MTERWHGSHGWYTSARMDLRELPEESAAPGLRHPWEATRAACFVRRLCDALPRDRPSSVLDVGAGDGYFASQLLAALPTGSEVTCLDSGYSDALLERLARSTPGPQQRFTRLRPEQRFDAIVMLDVIEHVHDAHGFVRAITAHNLSPHGVVLLSVPAHPAIFTQHDVDLGHHRRYTAGALAAVLAAAQLHPLDAGNSFHSLLLVRCAQKALERARGFDAQPAPAGLAAHVATGVGHWRHGPLLTAALERALALDAALGERFARAGLRLPGLSLWAVARPSSEGEP